MAAWQRRKGADGEREIVTAARSQGLKADRTWQSAQHWQADIRACDVRIQSLPFQVKRRAAGFKRLYDALEYTTGALVRDDGREWLAVVRLDFLLALLKKVFNTGGSNAGDELPTNPLNVPRETSGNDVHGDH